MGFVVGHAPCGLSPQIDGMPVIHAKKRDSQLCESRLNGKYQIVNRVSADPDDKAEILAADTALERVNRVY